jgi:formamidopyrimidine-DNA glycosylase
MYKEIKDEPMPELPEVETVRRGLEPAMVGKMIKRVDLRRADLRFPFPPDFAKQLEGHIILSLGRRAKYLLAELDNNNMLVMHLGMSGSFRIEDEPVGQFHHPRGEGPKHDHVRIILDDHKVITYNDPRRFGFMLLIPHDELAEHKVFKKIGIEPLGNSLNGPHLSALMAGKKTNLKAALLDQSLICGLGNIYVCESLFKAGLSPRKKASTLDGRTPTSREAASRLAQSIRDVLKQAVAAGGSSLRDHRQTDGSLGYFQHHFSVYDREGEPCPHKCGSKIKRIVQAGRSTFYCTQCQK